MTKFLPVLALTFVLAACDGIDRGECLESTVRVVYVGTHVGNMTIMNPIPVKTCVRWQFPQGNPDAPKKAPPAHGLVQR